MLLWQLCYPVHHTTTVMLIATVTMKLLLHLFFLKHDYDVRVDEMQMAAIKTRTKVVFCNM